MINPVDYTNLGVEFAESSPIKGITSALIRMSNDISEEFREYCLKNNIEATQALANSFGGLPVKVTDDGGEIRIEALDYFKFVDQGVDGVEQKHGSPFSFKTIAPPSIAGLNSIRLYVAAKVIPAIPDIDSITYAVAISIKKKGIRPKHIIDNVFAGGLLDRMAESYANAMETATGLTLDKKMKQWQ